MMEKICNNMVCVCVGEGVGGKVGGGWLPLGGATPAPSLSSERSQREKQRTSALVSVQNTGRQQRRQEGRKEGRTDGRKTDKQHQLGLIVCFHTIPSQWIVSSQHKSLAGMDTHSAARSCSTPAAA